MSYEVSSLPFKNESSFETKAVLKGCARAHRYLAELKGVARSIPNEAIIINTLSMQEAKDSSEIENVVTTHDELFKVSIFDGLKNPSAKEVERYTRALKHGFSLVRDNRLMRMNDVIEIQQILESNKAGFRKLPGTELRNQATGEVVYVPPQHPEEISSKMENLMRYINDPAISELDPLIKVGIIHFQFESIHPFYDGNGRTGRIINILYMVLEGLLELPILYLSHFIIRNKASYYSLLQGVRDEGGWEKWLLFILNGVEVTSKHTIETIIKIKSIMDDYKQRLRNKLPKIYSQDLLNNMFYHPYTKIEFLQEELGVTRLTASKYLDQLTEHSFLEKHKLGRSNYYVNRQLFEVLKNS